jgi:hypothetical protein
MTLKSFGMIEDSSTILEHEAAPSARDYLALFRSQIRLRQLKSICIFLSLYAFFLFYSREATVFLATSRDNLIFLLAELSISISIGLTFVLLWPQIRFRLIIRRMNLPDELTRFRLSTEGIDARSARSMFHFDWSMFRTVKAGDQRLFLFLDGVRAFVVPRGNLDDRAWAERRRFIESIVGSKSRPAA